MGRFAAVGSFAPAQVMAVVPRERGAPVILDLDHLRIFTGHDRELEREVLGLFLDELPKTQAALERATTQRDWHMAAHTLKGSALGVGAGMLADAARAAETFQIATQSGRDLIFAKIITAITDVQAEIGRLNLI
jgi:HPt (histidine-containing phosphotransfer) domain-containing protein